jgi:hypothetical protein
MIFAILILSVALVLCTQMVCSTWRDIHDLDREIRIRLADTIHDR